MTGEIEHALARWREAGILDADAVDRIAAFEQERAGGRGSRWPVILALVLGGVLLAAGVLLFVAAHWDTLSPAARTALVFALVAVFHLAGAFAAERSEPFAMLLHGLGTIALGAGIALLGQIFNMNEHWPAAIALWAAGAWAAWLLRRDWVQMSLAALLTPAWLVSEWTMQATYLPQAGWLAAAGVTLLATVYLSARTAEKSSPARRALAWIGGLAIIPSALTLTLIHVSYSYRPIPSDTGLEMIGWAIGVAAPLGVAWILRGRAAWMNVVAAACVIVLAVAAENRAGAMVYLWAAVSSAALAAWGFAERRSERINLGFAGFAITVLFFYFSELMDNIKEKLAPWTCFTRGGFSLPQREPISGGDS